jgi:hypothetical protein
VIVIRERDLLEQVGPGDTGETSQKMRWASGYPPAFGSETHGEPHPLDTIRLGGRYADYFVEQSTRAQAIVDLLDAVPTALWLVRGLDVASDELSVPTWVLVPLYRYVLWRSASAAATRSSEALPPLRLTAHVGEDFRHLMEGLRRVYECIQYVLKRSGGRLGHATALGVEPRLWAESVGSVMMPAEERLWDLVFEWRLYSHYRVPVELRAPAPPERVLRVEKDIHDLSERVFMRPCEPSELAEAHHVLHQLWCPPVAVGEIAGLGLDAFARALRRLDWDRVRSRRRVHAILEGYRENEAVFRRGQQLVDVTLDESEIAALQVAQDALRRCAGALGIVVEVNPSSNLLIGNLLDLRNHPILRLFPPEPQEGCAPGRADRGRGGRPGHLQHLLAAGILAASRGRQGCRLLRTGGARLAGRDPADEPGRSIHGALEANGAEEGGRAPQ